ncbi:MAG TPA: GNAT family N-acetyltransferase [Allosphingosinicella sp.]|nr:GNAT family N-acetyltransferase [Allosphingosinicella sp.]
MFARTERLLLRPGWREDAPALFRAIADERVVRNLATAPWPYRLEDAEAFLSADRRPWEPSMLIFRRTSAAPELVGTIGVGRRLSGEIELGYWIARRFWNRGYATEAGKAVVHAARHALRLPRLGAGHFVDNPASGRVLEKLGFRPTGITAPRHSIGRGGEAPCRLFELTLTEEAEPAAMAA